MRERGLMVAWVAAGVVFVVLLLLAVNQWRSLATQSLRAAGERERLTAAIRLREEEIQKEMRNNSALLQEMQWTAAGGDPSAFLTRLAEVARGARMKITAIGSLERRSTPQFNKSWHLIQVLAPYKDLRDLATKVEGEKGILEDMVLEVQQEGQRVGAPDELQARFKMTALELTQEAKGILERAVAQGGTAPQPPQPSTGAPLALPLPTRPGDAVVAVRDPFSFGGPPPAPPRRVAAGPRPAPSPAAPTAEPPKPPPAPMDLRGIVSFPGGFLAILNNQIVKVGDTVSGHRVERVTDNAVHLREPDGGTRTVPLPDLIPSAPAGPRR